MSTMTMEGLALSGAALEFELEQLESKIVMAQPQVSCSGCGSCSGCAHSGCSGCAH
ncbi:hypothetical protein ABT158_46810 [Nonomuraea sp. NPDC001636]|uniref:hypothetical protein n=1 Tax=Nonomuraea sp. NPDC001636 TaxID=3154391 RepID=UPI00332338DC